MWGPVKFLLGYMYQAVAGTLSSNASQQHRCSLDLFFPPVLQTLWTWVKWWISNECPTICALGEEILDFWKVIFASQYNWEVCLQGCYFTFLCGVNYTEIWAKIEHRRKEPAVFRDKALFLWRKGKWYWIKMTEAAQSYGALLASKEFLAGSYTEHIIKTCILLILMVLPP